MIKRYACEGKTTYPDKRSALKVAKEINNRKYLKGRNHNHAPAHVYKCECCVGYHISGQKRYKIAT